jgi:hypothetical protein
VHVEAFVRRTKWQPRKVWGGVLAATAITGVPLIVAASPASAADADIRVTEVAPRASSTALGDDWIELTNVGTATVDLTGWRVDDDSNNFNSAGLVSGVTSLAPGASAVFVTEADSSSVAAFKTAWFGASAPAGLQVGWLAGSGLGLGSGGDQINVFNATGTRVANVSFGSAGSVNPAPSFDNQTGANGAITAFSQTGVGGAFVSSNGSEVGSPGIASGGGGTPPTTTTTLPPTGPTFAAWPGSPAVQPAENYDFGEDMSGLDYEATGTGVLWAARNKAGTMFRLLSDGTNWVPDTANSWGAGKELRYPGGTGHPDSEGITYAGSTAADGIYIASERDNDNSGVSRNSVLRYDVSQPGAALSATQEWNLTADLPPTGANLGLEAVTWIDDSYLVSKGFLDESKGHIYNPAEYPNHGTGVFFVALEATGQIYAYALDTTGTFTRLATIGSDLQIVTDLQYDRDEHKLWAECDNTCNGRLTVLDVNQASGKFAATAHYERPANLADNNNEGFAIAPASACVNGTKPVYWADDGATGGVSIVQGALQCNSGPSPVVPEFPLPALAILSSGVLLGGWFVVRRRWAVSPA